MATTQLPCQILLRIVNASGQVGQEIPLDSYYAGPGGSTGGTPANTPEKWNYLAPSIVAGAGTALEFYVISKSTQTINTTDSYFNIPVTAGGQAGFISGFTSAAAMGNNHFNLDTALTAVSAVSGQAQLLARISIKPGMTWSIGGGKLFVSLQY